MTAALPFATEAESLFHIDSKALMRLENKTVQRFMGGAPWGSAA